MSCVGLVLVLGGEILRKDAMVTAASNFNHYVQHVKQDGHQLVEKGVYSLFRHPAYVGWFYWSVGTQVYKLYSHSRFVLAVLPSYILKFSPPP